MKIVQSFWSKPLLAHLDFTDVTSKTHKKNGGWLSEKIYYMSCALSVLKLKEFYDEVELVTDSYGKKMLIETFKLPFTSYSLKLNEIEHYHEDLWALGKLFAYKIQEKPFLHVDNDIFIWKSFDEKLMESDIIVQNKEVKNEFYELLCQEIVANFDFLPKELKIYTENGGSFDDNKISAHNFGVFGGKDIEFIKYYVDFSITFIDKNLKNLTKVKTGALSVYFEQSIFYCLSYIHCKKASQLFDNYEDIDDITNYFCHFENIPAENFIHTIGSSKRNPTINEQVYLNLLNDYPVYHKIINDYFKN